ncbi:transcriptional regulator [Paenibacillus uliginis N3/975]|uniref:Transcriptional regulator n=1 Tax=Paenibacillus uliginis N3/975 TaxID=1313296 RepID=A0A1X7HFJ1_9BACL|nr:metalloregulator ArsR/SmtB family transcription factor [Paenibacillus uliginis]SMF85765.1 transcriptional regulator [Paenibacillus uliginis N3/975]
MRQNQNKKDASMNTRRAIINLLKEHAGMDVVALSDHFSLNGMAIRQHLNALQEEGLVTYEEEARPMGRPTKLWKLTPAADRFFSSGYSDLSLSLIHSMKEAFGSEGMDKLLAVRNKKMQKQYLNYIGDTSVTRERLEKLAEIRTNEGYMAEIKQEEDGCFLFIEKHCPICEAAATCAGLCKNELQLFHQVLGNDVTVERVEYILSGGRSCVYRVQKMATKNQSTNPNISPYI